MIEVAISYVERLIKCLFFHSRARACESHHLFVANGMQNRRRIFYSTYSCDFSFSILFYCSIDDFITLSIYCSIFWFNRISSRRGIGPWHSKVHKHWMQHECFLLIVSKCTRSNQCTHSFMARHSETTVNFHCNISYKYPFIFYFGNKNCHQGHINITIIANQHRITTLIWVWYYRITLASSSCVWRLSQVCQLNDVYEKCKQITQMKMPTNDHWELDTWVTRRYTCTIAQYQSHGYIIERNIHR